MILEIIEKKKRGDALDADEIRWFIDGVTRGTIPEYQISALLMAIYFQGMNAEETFALTAAMRDSGETLDLRNLGLTIDKHSTGGIGDTLSLIVLPIWAAAGLKIVKLSGRGLGFTGGTIDKLSAVPGFRTDLDTEDFLSRARESEITLSAQSERLAPADKILYALRDVTATVDSIPLIAASVMSKKLAVAADVLILDVKYGRGAFMKTREDAEMLARTMIEIGEGAGQKVASLLSPMDWPLGCAVGNALEVEEAYGILNGEGPAVLRDAALQMASLGLHLAKPGYSMAQAWAEAEGYLQNGGGMLALNRFLIGQGATYKEGNLLGALPRSDHHYEVISPSDGYVRDIDASAIGVTAMHLGAGRKVLGDRIDLAAGIVLKKEVGDAVASGEVLAVLYGDDFKEDYVTQVENVFTIGGEPPVIEKEITVLGAKQV